MTSSDGTGNFGHSINRRKFLTGGMFRARLLQIINPLASIYKLLPYDYPYFLACALLNVKLSKTQILTI
jgi:hypothetical protein